MGRALMGQAARQLVLLALLATPSLAGELLAGGRTLDLQLDPAGPVQLELPAPQGSYLAGRIAAGAGGVSADLLDEDGAHVRRIARDDAGVTEFRLVTEGEGMRLRLTGSGPVSVTLTDRVPPDRQVPAGPDYLSPGIGRLAAELAAGGDSAAFWAEVEAAGTPLVEPAGKGRSILTFLWRGAERNVRLFGGPSSDHDWLERLGGSDVWFRSYEVPDDTRLSYKLAPDIPDVPGGARARRVAILSRAQMDPLNRNPWPADAPDRFGQSATVALPDAPPQPGTPPLPDAAPVLDSFTYDSALLGNSRRITLSHPRGVDPADPRLVTLLIFDGEDALGKMDAPRMLETLTRQGRLPPVLAVMIPSIDSETRARELPDNRVFAQALASELLPLVRNKTGIVPDPRRTAVAGASFGGLAAATVPLYRPESFGNAISLSGSFWWGPKGSPEHGLPHVASLYAEAGRLPIRFFLSAGSFERGRQDGAGILETSAIMRDVLKLWGYEVTWREYAGGHDYLVWRGALADGMIALFGDQDDPQQ